MSTLYELPDTAAALRRPLLSWYGRNARRLPWRSEPQPYYVLLSEFMCQQTRINTVLPYFARFIARWPTLEALAAADQDEVLREWAGLGYYSRARNLLRAAQAAVVAGGLTGNVQALRALPGVGPYTAGAIASVAFGVPAALVDGNVERVLCRLTGMSDDPRTTAGQKLLWRRAEELIEGSTEPGAHNQALMELGALVCSPRAPRCEVCPWQEVCVAAAQGQPERLPNKPQKAPPTPVVGTCVVIKRGASVLMGQRGPGLLAGMWEPLMSTEYSEPRTLTRQVVGLYAERVTALGTVRHTFSHRRLTLTVFTVTATGTPGLGGGYTQVRFVDPHLDDVALSKLARKVLALDVQPQQSFLLAADSPMEER